MRVKIIVGQPHYSKGTGIFTKTQQEDLEEKINAFLEEIEPSREAREGVKSQVIDIKYTNTWIWMGDYEDSYLDVSAMILYK